MMSWLSFGENSTDLRNIGPAGDTLRSGYSETHRGAGDGKDQDVQILGFIEVLSQDGVSKLRWPAEMVKYTTTKPSISFSCNLFQCNLMRLLRLQPQVQPKIDSGETVYTDRTDKRDIQSRPTLHVSQGSYFSNSEGSHRPSSQQKRSWDASCSSECDDDECCLPSRKVQRRSISCSRSKSIPTYTPMGYYDDCRPSLRRSWSRSRSRSRSQSNPKYAHRESYENYHPPSHRLRSRSRSYSRSRSFSRSRSQSRSRSKPSEYGDDDRWPSCKFKSESQSFSMSRSPGVRSSYPRSRSRSISRSKDKHNYRGHNDSRCQPSHRSQSRSHSGSRPRSPRSRSRCRSRSRSYNRSPTPTRSKPKYDYKEYDDGSSEGSPRYCRYWSRTYGRYRWSRVHSSSPDDSTRLPSRPCRSRTRSKSKDKGAKQPPASTVPGKAPSVPINMGPIGPQHFIPLNPQSNMGQPIHLQPIIVPNPMHQAQMMSAHLAQQQGFGPLLQRAMNPAQQAHAQQAHTQQAHAEPANKEQAETQQAHAQQAKTQQAHAQQAKTQQAHAQQAHAAAAVSVSGGQPQMMHLPLHAHPLAAQSTFSPVTMTSIQTMQTIHVTHGLPIPGLAPQHMLPPMLPHMPHPMAMQMPGMPMLFR